jgi:hypothetical protein
MLAVCCISSQLSNLLDFSISNDGALQNALLLVNDKEENSMSNSVAAAPSSSIVHANSGTGDEIKNVRALVSDEKKPTSNVLTEKTAVTQSASDSSGLLGNTRIIDSSSPKSVKTSQPTLVITGLVKNAEEHLPKLEAVIRRVAEDFRLEGIIFYENDSTDKSVEILNSWKWPKNLTLISETNVTIPDRTDRLARGRNIVMSEVMKMPNAESIDYLLILDMDEVNYHLSHVTECLNLPSDFGVCCANQFKVYYDLWYVDFCVCDDSLLAFCLGTFRSPLGTIGLCDRLIRTGSILIFGRVPCRYASS